MKIDVKNILFTIYFLTSLTYAQQYSCPYFPMEFGKSWNYSSNDFPDTLVSSIIDTATINDLFYYAFAPYRPNTNYNKYWLRPEPKKIFALNMEDSTEYLLFNFEAELNRSWPIPPDIFYLNVPINQCDWGNSILCNSNSDTLQNPNRLFLNSFLFSHSGHPCMDAGIVSTWFSRDFGIVRFSQVTEGGVLDWELIVEPPDTVLIIGSYEIASNPCLTSPCIPGIVSALKSNDIYYILSKDENWFWNNNFSWNGFVPDLGDSVSVTGIITKRTDIFGENYFTLEIIDFSKHIPTSVSEKLSDFETMTDLLKQNYPNPFNPVTKIKYLIKEGGHTKLQITDVLGKEIVVLVDEYKNSGFYEIIFTANGLPSGIYFYKLEINGVSEFKKMVLLR